MKQKKQHLKKKKQRWTLKSGWTRNREVTPFMEHLEDRVLLSVVVESGDFVTEITRLKDLAFGNGSNLYVAPSAQEQADFNTLASTLQSGDIANADTQAVALGYELVEFTDTVSGDVYHGLREELVGGEQTRGWGSYFVNLDFQADGLIEIPHPLFDTNSWDVGAKIFRDSGARGYLMAGAHRNANGTGSADVAHLANSIFHEVHESWVGTASETDSWQLHAFDIANHPSFPAGTDAVLSNGDGTVSSEIISLEANLEANLFDTYTYNTLSPTDPVNVALNGGVDGTTFSGLAGTTNEQGNYSRSLGGTFVHVELERSIRFDAANRDLAAADISNAVLDESGFLIIDSAIRPAVSDLSVTIDFDADVDVATVQTTDLLVNGVASATSVNIDDTDTVTFTISSLAIGTHSLQIDAGTIAASEGTALGEWSHDFDIVSDAQYTINHSPRLQLGDAPLVGYSGSETDQVELMWQTVSAGIGTQDSFTVDYRLDGTTDPWAAAPATSQIVIPTGGRVNHYTVITGLNYDDAYEYRVRHLQGGVIVDEYASSFHTRLPAGDQTTYSFAAYGDSADIDDILPFRDVQSRINTVDPAFALLLGDNVYDSGTHNESDARFDHTINPEAAAWTAGHIDYVGFGNHDVVTDGGQPGEDNFSVPIPIAGVTAPAEPPATEQIEHNYSFDYGNVHFVTFDTNSLGSASRLDGQLSWIEADIAASSADWIIVFGHHPVTGSPDKSQSASDNYYQQVVPRLHAAGVDVFLMGHSHTYHRTMPLLGQSGGVETFVLDTDNDYAKGDGLVQLVAGTGGKSLRSGTFTQYPFNAAGFSTSTTPAVEYGFAKFDVTPTQLTVSYIAADDGATLDQFTITSGPDMAGPTASVSNPLDNGPSDLNATLGNVRVTSSQPTFDIQLSDSSGIDDATVTAATVSVSKDTVALVESVDYTFSYDAASDVVTLTSLSSDFDDGVYDITLSDGASTIDDALGNAMNSTLLAIEIDTSVQIVSFQQGVGGYTGTVDTMLEEADSLADNSTVASLNVDNDTPASTGQDAQVLLRFDNLFGSDPGQIPSGATILSATLALDVSNAGDAMALHRMLTSWSDIDTWSSLLSGVSPDNVEAASVADVTTAGVSTGILEIDVTTSLQSWIGNPGQNLGWAILPTGGNGVDFDSSEGTAPPRLEVHYTIDANPPTSLYESFEDGLGPEWSITSVDPEARIQIRDLAAEGIITTGPSLEYTQNGNPNSLVFDSTNLSGDGVADLGLAIWTVDLSAFTADAILTYHQFEGDGSGSGDENDSLPAGAHATTATGDGISISIDGTNWYELFDFAGSDLNRSGDGLWQLHEIDLAAEIARINSSFGAGLSLTSGVQFKWSQYDTHSLPEDGWAIDEIRIQQQADTFTAARPRGAFHQFTVVSEDDGDYFYRAAMFGNVTATTPILVSTHGDTGAFDYDSYARDWHRFVADPANGVNSLIVVTPVFIPGATRYDDHHTFGWNRNDDAAADLVLIETVDDIAASGFGDASELFLWGFSAGGQFTNRFTAAHPDRVAAAVVGGAGVQMLPADDIAFPRGFGERYTYPIPVGVTLNIDEYLKSRIQFWVGENDNDPSHSQLDQSNETTSVQGEDRVERAANQFEAVVVEAVARGISPTDFEHELFIAADRGHTWNALDLPQIYDFLFRSRNATDLPIEVHPLIVVTPSADEQVVQLPQNVTQLDPGQQFYVELWVTAPAGTTDGVRSGQLDLYFDPAVATINAAAIDHGSLFNTSTGHTYDLANDPGFVRGFTGTTAASGIGVDDYALFGRMELTASGSILDPTQLVLGLQRSANLDFELETLVTRRTDFQPFSLTVVDDDDQGVQGVVFDDVDGNGIQDAAEIGIAGRTVELQTTGGAAVTLGRGVEPDNDGAGSYLNEASPWATLSAIGADILNPGVRSFTSTGNASTGDQVFSYFFDDGVTTSGVGSLWRSGDRSLRIDFNVPASSISIDAIGTSSSDVARLDVYDAADVLLGTVTTSVIPAGVVETITFSHANIAYAVATGDAQTVRLDNLQFDVQPVVTTDASGQYELSDLDIGTFNVVAELPAGWNATTPVNSEQQVEFVAGQVVVGQDFGQVLGGAAGVTVSPISGDTTETGGVATFSVVLDSQPTATVTIGVASSDLGEGVPDVSELTFTNTDWDTPQIVAVTGVDDLLVDGDIGYTIVLDPAGSSDLAYNGLDPADVAVINLDDDVPVANCYYPVSGALIAGGTNYTAGLEPTADPFNAATLQSTDGSAQSITEGEGLVGSSKKPKKTSALDYYQWSFGVVQDVTSFHMDAWRDSNSEGDDFTFEYSLDGGGWAFLATVNASTSQLFDVDLSATPLNGDLQLRVIDTNRSPVNGNNNPSFDSVHVDAVSFDSLMTDLREPVSIDASDTSAAEFPIDTGEFTISRSGTVGDLTVFYTVSGSADAGSDFVSLTGSAVILDGQNSATVTVTPINDPDAEGNEMVTVTLDEDDSYAYKVGGSGSATVTIIDDDLTTFTATSETTVTGSVIANNYTATAAADGVEETIEEDRSGGNPSNRTSFMDHRWTFTGVSSAQSFHLTASRPDNAEGDDFEFQYSLDGGQNWTSLTTVNSPNATLYSVSLATSISGTVIVRVVDTDPNTAGNSTRDTVEVDQMYFSTAPLAAAVLDSPQEAGSNDLVHLEETATMDPYLGIAYSPEVRTQSGYDTPDTSSLNTWLFDILSHKTDPLNNDDVDLYNSYDKSESILKHAPKGLSLLD